MRILGWINLALAIVVGSMLLSCAGRQAGDSGLGGGSAQLAELKALPAPGGVSPDVWTALKNELTRVLAEQQSFKRTSAAPLDARSKVTNLTISDAAGRRGAVYLQLPQHR